MNPKFVTCLAGLGAFLVVGVLIFAMKHYTAPAPLNAFVDAAVFRRGARVLPEALEALADAERVTALSARALDRVLRVARTIADLAGAEAIATAHLAEAIQLRRVLRSE